MTNFIPEPPRNDDDTNPSRVLRVVSAPSAVRPNPAARLLNLLLLISAAGLTVLAAVLYIQQGQQSPKPTMPATSVVIVPNGAPTDVPVSITATPRPQLTAASPLIVNLDQAPAPDVLGALMLEAPNLAPVDNLIYRQQTAFTIAPARPRSGPVEYRIQVGDTIEKIAQRFNITQDSIIWNNDVGYVNRLAVGTTLRIPPVNGILYTTLEPGGESIQQMADKFKVSPYAIIDSEYNKLQAATPETVIPRNELEVMIPGGVTKTQVIYWKPVITVNKAGGGGNGTVSFGGGAGSCGSVSNGGGDGSLGRPLDGYTVIRGFSSYHTGIDLAKSSGSPVFAAGTGTIIFAGWSDWGYGNAIVIAHTPSLWTLYGHLSRINVSCGQTVARGSMIGAVGSTGNSTGPHLHFETRIGGDPVNPISILGGF